MAEQRKPAHSDDTSGSGNRAALWSAFFRVAEVGSRSTPQLVAICGTAVALAVTFPWMTITRIRHGGPFDWLWVVLGLVVTFIALCVLQVSVPAAAESFARRINRWRSE